MLTPEYMAGVSDAAEEVADKLHNKVMERIIERLMARNARGEDFKLTATDKWNIETLQQAGFLYEDVLEEIQKYSGETSASVAKAFKDAGVRTLRNDQKIYDKMGIAPIDPLRSPQYMAMMETDYQLTNGTLKNLTQTTADSAQQTFIEQCDEIYTAVTRGTDTLGHALFDAVEKISDANGLWVTYPSGARTSVEAAVTRCVRTGVAQMAGRVSEKRAQEVGCDHYLVSSHLGARPSHAVWQGQVFKIHGSDKKYKNFYETTGYGTGPGLCGWNCRHSFSPFFPEFMENNMKQYSVEENAEAYEKRQEEMAELRKARELARKKQAYEKASELTEDRELRGFLSDAIDKIKSKTSDLKDDESSDTMIDTGWVKSPIKDIKSFSELNAYIEKQYGISLDAGVMELDFESVRDAMAGFDTVALDYPGIKSNLTCIRTGISSKKRYMETDGFELIFNEDEFAGGNKLKESLCDMIRNGSTVANSSVCSVGAHEAGHCIERLLILKDPSIKKNWIDQKNAWDGQKKSKAISKQAIKNVRQTPYGQGKRKKELITAIYSAIEFKPTEIFAEAICDVYSNGNKANPLSKEIKRLADNALKGVS